MNITEKVIFRSIKFKKAGSDIDKKTGKQFNYEERYAVKFEKIIEEELLEFEINIKKDELALIEKFKNLKPLQEIKITLELNIYRDTIRLKITDFQEINITDKTEPKLKQAKLFN